MMSSANPGKGEVGVEEGWKNVPGRRICMKAQREGKATNFPRIMLLVRDKANISIWDYLTLSTETNTKGNLLSS